MKRTFLEDPQLIRKHDAKPPDYLCTNSARIKHLAESQCSAICMAATFAFVELLSFNKHSVFSLSQRFKT